MPMLGLAVLLSACGPRRDVPGGDIEFSEFEAADLDHSGLLDRAEVEKAFPHWIRAYDRIDSDHSGLISWPEARVSRLPRLRQPEMPR